MARKYNFEPIESGGTDYVIADPVNDNKDPVRLEARWVEGDEVEGEWERAIGALIKSDLLGSMELKEGNGRIERQEAIETLAEVEDDEGSIVTSEDQAEALLEYFAEEEIVELDGSGSDVLVLRNPQDEAEMSGRMVLNWAAGIDACVEKISETIDRVRQAKEKLEDRMDEIDQNPGEIEAKMQETAQELKSLGDGQGVPESPSELPPEERSRYNQLKRKLVFHRKMQEVIDTDLTEKVEEGTNKLSDSIEQLESARIALDQKQQEVRTRALQEQEFPEGANNIVENMGELATQLAGVGGIDEAVEETDPTELADIVDEVTGEVAEVTESATETAGEETVQEQSGNLEMG
jgi:prefoldin subunit 5